MNLSAKNLLKKFPKKRISLSRPLRKIFDIEYKKKNEEIELFYSNYHYELDLYQFKFIDMYLIIEFIKQYTSNINIFTNTHNVIIIKNFQLASKNIQFALRRIMEKNINTCRFIFLINSLGNLEEALISRTILLRLNQIKDSEIKNILKNVININKFSVSTKNLNKIIAVSENDITKSLCLLENCIDGIEIENNYELDSLINLIETSNKILDINIIRTKLYNILLYITPSLLIEKITLKILKDYDMNIDIRNKILELACNTENNVNLGFRSIYHIEYFIIELICLFN